MFTSFSVAVPLLLMAVLTVAFNLLLTPEALEAYSLIALAPLGLLALQFCFMGRDLLFPVTEDWRWHFAFVPMLVGGRRFYTESAGWFSGYVWFGAYERRACGLTLTDSSVTEVRRQGVVTMFDEHFI